jgi:hypothetical protein|tara:strand:+ start:764 stop:1267 length:504 start_codon:yes stop_codon:yes gene_type:complete
MPIYVTCKTKSGGEFFLKCGSKEVAGRNANTLIDNCENASLVLDYGWDIQISQTSGTSTRGGSISFSMFLVVPAYQPTISSAYNAFSLNDDIVELVITVVDKNLGVSKPSIVGTYTAHNGTLISAGMVHSHDSKDSGKLNLNYQFEKIIHDNKITNTTGIVKETSAF